MRKPLVGLIVVGLVAVAGVSGCATKGFVRSEVGKVNGKVDTLGQSLEQTQERTRLNEEKIAAVDTKAQGAQSAAGEAQRSATAADGKAVMAETAARTAGEKSDAVALASRRLLYTVVLTEDESGFKFNGVEVSAEAKARIDAMIGKVIADPKGAYFEIEGHTDNVGTKTVNDRIGLERAEAVKRYLYEQHHVPLHRINVISYGPERPLVPNTTRDGRAQNRRIVIRVLN
jgi:outer membrane protein OmpA-like peptidoglycan-associated protein